LFRARGWLHGGGQIRVDLDAGYPKTLLSQRDRGFASRIQYSATAAAAVITMQGHTHSHTCTCDRRLRTTGARGS
jgi:hypothetical protein